MIQNILFWLEKEDINGMAMRFESTYAGMNDSRVRGQDARVETQGRARPDTLHRYHSFKSLVQFQLYLLPADLTTFARQDRHGPHFVDVEGGEMFCPKSQSRLVAKSKAGGELS